ncbi:hypothetical protein [Streptomyces sp. CRN 30]|uniref:hypothetical protein n=1 Tax=Streptomyces sp. CRN 30 TaxID=3075613 RepID=UPI002A7F1F50|nr:hypothetical protein [Streptomyces sp. CRN 30]
MRRAVRFPGWFAGGRLGYPKNLTALLVDDEGTTVAWGFDARDQWAKALDEGRGDGLGYAYAFKTALTGGAAAGLPVVGGRLDLADRDRVTGLIAAYLEEVRGVVMAEIRALGHTEHEVRWCVTVPAVWDDVDKSVMRRAAVAAGFPDDPERLLLASEPEAVALSCYLRMTESDTPDSARLPLDEPGVRFVVVDCGGGTVDITAYETDRTLGRSVGLRETGVATTGRLGSEYVNQAFRDKALADRFGAAVLRRIERDHAGDLLAMCAQWERHKTTAELAWDDDGTARVADAALIDVPPGIWDLLDGTVCARLTREAGGAPRRLRLAPEEVQSLLDEVVGGIVEKVEEQLAGIRRTAAPGARPEILVLAGGFARSAWLRDRMRRRFGARHRVLVPPDPAIAVLEGATLIAHDPSVLISRQAKYTYGFGTSMPFEDSRDSVERMYRDDDGELLCVGRFLVAVRRMDPVRVDDAFPFQVCPVRRDQRRMEVRLYRTARPDPRYVDEEGSEEIGRMTVDMRDTVGRPLRERPLVLLFYFGACDLRVEAFDPGTGGTTRVTVDFARL